MPVVRRAEMLAELMRLKVRRDRRHARQDDDDLDGRNAARRRRARSDRGQWRHHQRLWHQCAVGAGDWMVVEADETRRHVPELPTEVAIVTNIDPEHLDHFKTFEAVRKRSGISSRTCRSTASP